YDLLIDKHARNHRREPEFKAQSFFRQLQHIFIVPLPAIPDLGLQPTSFILAAIQNCVVEAKNNLDMHYYKKLGHVERRVGGGLKAKENGFSTVPRG
ncbi:hypothetical protein H0H81_004856, partial [Sphagnurus paluster]